MKGKKGSRQEAETTRQRFFVGSNVAIMRSRWTMIGVRKRPFCWREKCGGWVKVINEIGVARLLNGNSRLNEALLAGMHWILNDIYLLSASDLGRNLNIFALTYMGFLVGLVLKEWRMRREEKKKTRRIYTFVDHFHQNWNGKANSIYLDALVNV